MHTGTLVLCAESQGVLGSICGVIHESYLRWGKIPFQTIPSKDTKPIVCYSNWQEKMPKRIKIQKMGKAKNKKNSQSEVQNASGARPGASAQISQKPKHPRAGGFLANKKSSFGLSQCSSFLRRAFKVCSWAACMLAGNETLIILMLRSHSSVGPAISPPIPSIGSHRKAG